MKVYRLSIQDTDLGTMLEWHPSKRAAQKARSDLEPGTSAEIEPIDVPTDRAGLLKWLNDNFTSDNG
jgi:hypothetical protein